MFSRPGNVNPFVMSQVCRPDGSIYSSVALSSACLFTPGWWVGNLPHLPHGSFPIGYSSCDRSGEVTGRFKPPASFAYRASSTKSPSLGGQRPGIMTLSKSALTARSYPVLGQMYAASVDFV